MTFKQKVTEGQIVELNGKDYRATADGFEPVVSKGPLGGELKRLSDCEPDEKITIQCRANDFNWIDKSTLVETNIPPRPQPAKIGDLQPGQRFWVEMVCDSQTVNNTVAAYHVPQDFNANANAARFHADAPCLLIEGVDL